MAPAILVSAATALAQGYPELYAGGLVARIEWVGRVAEQVAYWADSRGSWGVCFGDPIVAHWAADHALEIWRFDHRADRAATPYPCDATRGAFVDVRPCDWLCVQPILAHARN